MAPSTAAAAVRSAERCDKETRVKDAKACELTYDRRRCYRLLLCRSVFCANVHVVSV